ncbi:hypothetical protein TNCV_3522171 [Trichonephila clavipes]|uniref:Uncharacterized protein n=1 Tax=Trichonephila clavipes TaxID=2585209 RepID=A0A8X7BH99_TRICX|nr:hypothetical protein TNCV_3522171 [Trichonephila clavipes]
MNLSLIAKAYVLCRSRSLPPNYLGVTKRRINNVFCLLPIQQLPVTTARLETHNVYTDIGARGTRSGMRWNVWDRLSDNSSKEPSPIGAEKGKTYVGI